MNNACKIHLYTRVSTFDQADTGYSLETQRAKLYGWCEMKGYKLDQIKIYTDAGISGALFLERIQLQELLENIKKGDIMVVCALDRMSRCLKDAMKIIEILNNKKASLICLNPEFDLSSSFGRCMFQIMASFAELEKSMIQDRVKANMQSLKAAGLLRNKPVFGYIFDGKDNPYIQCPKQQEVIKLIIEMFTNEVPISDIMRFLNENGHNKVLSLHKKKPIENQQFKYETVRRILIDSGLLESDIRNAVKDKYLDSRKNSKVVVDENV